MRPLLFAALLSLAAGSQQKLRGVHGRINGGNALLAKLLGRHSDGVLGGGLGGLLAGGRRNAAMDQMSGIMRASQARLSVAEARIEKAVEKSRQEAGVQLKSSGEAAGHAAREYLEELSEAESDLARAVSVAQRAVADSELAEAKLMSWNSPGSEQRAKLGALVAMSRRGLQRASRLRKRAGDSVVHRAGAAVDDETSELSLKLGDISQLVQAAKEALVQEVQERPDTSDQVKAKPMNSTVVKSPAEATARMVKAEAQLKNANGMYRDATKAAENKLDVALAQVAKHLQAEVKKLTTAVDEEELKKLRAEPHLRARGRVPAPRHLR